MRVIVPICNARVDSARFWRIELDARRWGWRGPRRHPPILVVSPHPRGLLSEQRRQLCVQLSRVWLGKRASPGLAVGECVAPGLRMLDAKDLVVVLYESSIGSRNHGQLSLLLAALNDRHLVGVEIGPAALVDCIAAIG